MKGQGASGAGEAGAARGARPGLVPEAVVAELERAHARGMTSRQIVDVFETHSVRFSEATLRKYVQLGLLPRSERVGRKGKHRGSCGLYPALVVRRINEIKSMLADNLTIEDIQRSFARFQQDIDAVERGLRELMTGLEREARVPALDETRRRDLEREIHEARKAAGELVRRISGLERRLSSRAAEDKAAGLTVGGGSDLY